MKTRREIAYEEATRDPIFLFQRGYITLNEHALTDDYYPCPDCEGVFNESEEEHLAHHDDFDCSPLTGHELIERELAERHWHTETVFYTREEGEAYGKARAYNYPGGWRVYCVPASGGLASILSGVKEA